MMALVSELSMNQAQAMKLQQEVKEKEAELEQCYIRMEKGDAPSQEIELEWEKMMRDLERKIEEVELRRQVNCHPSCFLHFSLNLTPQYSHLF